MYNYTKNSSLIDVLIYEINFRWEKVIKPTLKLDDKITIKYLINLLLNKEHVNKIEKEKLIQYIIEIE